MSDEGGGGGREDCGSMGGRSREGWGGRRGWYEEDYERSYEERVKIVWRKEREDKFEEWVSLEL